MKQSTHITPKQQDILKLLYAYRYLDRAQIQAALGHKDKQRIILWLKDLREKHYIEWIYDGKDFAAKTKPAIYYLGINGIRYLRAEKSRNGSPLYPVEEIRKRYRDSSRSQAFTERSLLVAHCVLGLKALNTSIEQQAQAKHAEATPGDKKEVRGTNSTAPKLSASYDWFPEARYIDENHAYRFLAELDTLRPNLCIVKRDKHGNVVANYLLEIFDANLPRYRMRYRLKKYVEYLDDQEWELDEIQPIVLLVCSSLTELIYAKRATKKLIEDTYAEKGTLPIRFTTAKTLQERGMTAAIWEEGRVVWEV